MGNKLLTQNKSQTDFYYFFFLIIILSFKKNKIKKIKILCLNSIYSFF